MQRLLTVILAGAFVTGVWAADDKPEKPLTEQDKASYSLGYQIGQDFKKQGVAVKPDAVSRGLADSRTGADPLLTPDEMRRTLLELKRRMTSQEALASREEAAKQGAQDEAFLAGNSKQEGVVSLQSGLQYKVMQAGTGKRPGLNDRVAVNYRASLTSGVEFDRTEAEPAIFVVKEVIPGWREGLKLMQEGAYWQLFIPPNLGYGVRGPLANRAVILEVELLTVLGAVGTDTAATPPEDAK